MSFQNNYRKSVNQHKIPDKLLAETKDLMVNQIPKSKISKVCWRVAIPVCGLVMAISLTAIVYGATGGLRNPPVNKTDVSSVRLDAKKQADDCQTQKTIEKNGLYITINKIICNKEETYFTFDVQSKDGTPLRESDEFCKSALGIGSYTKSKVQVGGKEYVCNVFSSFSDDKALYTCRITGDLTSQKGAEASLVLHNLVDSKATCEDAGFLFDNLGELYKKMTPENPDNFIKTGQYNVYADKTLIAPSWTIPAGKQHIAFSSQFPDSYIDNIGFHKTGEYGCQFDRLYISITPGNSKDAAALKKLCFQNIKTLKPVCFENAFITGCGIEQVGFKSDKDYRNAFQADQDRKLRLNGGRIVIALELSADKNTLFRDCTVEDLNTYRIMKNFNAYSVTDGPSEWEIPFTLTF